VDASLQLCEQRDPKGLYARARSGQLAGMTGVSAPYEDPSDPDLVLRSGEETVESAVERVPRALAAQALPMPVFGR
jgi:adenylylsulfate kinase-like enzyme